MTYAVRRDDSALEVVDVGIVQLVHVSRTQVRKYVGVLDGQYPFQYLLVRARTQYGGTCTVPYSVGQ